MTCPRCGTVFPARITGQLPRLHCNECGTRLFAWLGDHFGTRDAVPAPAYRPKAAGPNTNTILFGVFAFIVFFSCICLAALSNGI